VLARAARDAGVLTVGVVTKPFHFEGAHRMRLAEQGIIDLQQVVDTLIVIPNQNLFRVANEKTTFADAFKMADDVLCAGVRGITDLMVMPGLVNLDFADIRTVMMEMGKAMMGTGESEGENRALRAAEAAISNPLLDDVSMKGARGVLINITGGYDITMFEIDEAVNRIREEVDPNANIIFGTTFDQNMNGKVRLSIVATGIDSEQVRRHLPEDNHAEDRSGYGYMQTTRRLTPSAAAPAVAPAVRPTPAAATLNTAVREPEAATTVEETEAKPSFFERMTGGKSRFIPKPDEDTSKQAPAAKADLDIPAFLRRQAN
jgi:cell division protein FtsZ